MARKALPQEGTPVKVGWTLPKDLVKTLRHLAVERGVKISVLVQEALERYVREQKNV